MLHRFALMNVCFTAMNSCLSASLACADGHTQVLLELERLGAKTVRDDALPGRPVVSVDLTSSSIKDIDFEKLESLKNLKKLDLRNTKITDAAIKRIAAFDQLQVLSLSWTDVTDKGLKELVASKRLQELYLIGVKLTDDKPPASVSVRRILLTVYRTPWDWSRDAVKALAGLFPAWAPGKIGGANDLRKLLGLKKDVPLVAALGYYILAFMEANGKDSVLGLLNKTSVAAS